MPAAWPPLRLCLNVAKIEKRQCIIPFGFTGEHLKTLDGYLREAFSSVAASGKVRPISPTEFQLFQQIGAY